MTILICPYCLTQKSEDDVGCCDEPSSHFQEIDLVFPEHSQRVNITLPAQVVALARSYNLNISQITREAIKEAVDKKRNDAKLTQD